MFTTWPWISCKLVMRPLGGEVRFNSAIARWKLRISLFQRPSCFLQIAFQISWYRSVQADEASWSSDQRRPNDFDGQKPQRLSDGQWSMSIYLPFHTLFSEMNTKISLMMTIMFHDEMWLKLTHIDPEVGWRTSQWMTLTWTTCTVKKL